MNQKLLIFRGNELFIIIAKIIFEVVVNVNAIEFFHVKKMRKRKDKWAIMINKRLNSETFAVYDFLEFDKKT